MRGRNPFRPRNIFVCLVLQVAATVIGYFVNLQLEAGFGRHFERFSAGDLLPAFPGQLYLQIAREYLHQLFRVGIKFKVPRKHDAESFFNTITEKHGSTRNSAVKINIGFFGDRNIAEL